MRALTGKNILVTRPQGQSETLARLVRDEGGNPILFPAIEIVSLKNHGELERILSRIEDYDTAIFVSGNAVRQSLTHLGRAWPERVKVAAMGEATVSALREFRLEKVIKPRAGADSESLLQSAELQNVKGKRILIFRGEGGRELLKQTLIARGATVAYAECYRRQIPESDSAPVIELLSRSQLHAITATSSEALRNLCAMLRGSGALKKIPLFVPHPRIAAAAEELEFERVVTTRAGDSGIIGGLVEWFGTRI